MEDNLLTYEEIQSVMIEANTNTIYDRQDILFIGNKSPIDIVKKSKKGLIFIEGNDDTGFKHIVDRHSYYSNRNDWIDDNRLDNPSRFSKKLIPIYHLAEIVDDIYVKENLDNEKNKIKDKFDRYCGISERFGEKTKYIMLLYKHSTIVHTLFPDDDKSKKKKVKHFNYVKGGISYSYDVKNAIVTYQIPYFNKKKVILYRIILRRNYAISKELVYLQVNSFTGIPLVAYLKLEKIIHGNPDDYQKYADYLEFNELLDFQRLILEFEEWYKSPPR